MATFTVTNINDSGAGSLRTAITNANKTVAKDIIKFATSTNGKTIQSNSVLNVTNPVDIIGNGTASTTVAGKSTFDTFAVQKGTVTFQKLTITKGNDNVDITGNSTNVTLKDVVLSNAADDGFDLSGNTNTVTLDKVISKTNTETGVEIDGDNNKLTIKNSELSGNKSPDGALFLDQDGTKNTVTVSATKIINNNDDGVDIDSNDNILNFHGVTLTGNTDDGISVDGDRNKINFSSPKSPINNKDCGIELKGKDNVLTGTKTQITFSGNPGGNITDLGSGNKISSLDRNEFLELIADRSVFF
ncbi:MAG: right-handed parallel beta-helix repeat-containing protein [Gomphosphaeria aponina SAG 52.96 = DSM 107014]|uniref:Right-handed parallel beta-helix repeat-containing protein n=1 Tax=Gomphosphaeria aponina SAG 52.96 = DSM 107014 TaxID=1521640 RepID=A0A941GQ31_9CHRO|nr:right-handed parallel beta-helix repeat-containing protein [Gomphosphaeria aponina SAG 52.96 = DSM 107014]